MKSALFCKQTITIGLKKKYALFVDDACNFKERCPGAL